MLTFFPFLQVFKHSSPYSHFPVSPATKFEMFRMSLCLSHLRFFLLPLLLFKSTPLLDCFMGPLPDSPKHIDFIFYLKWFSCSPSPMILLVSTLAYFSMALSHNFFILCLLFPTIIFLFFFDVCSIFLIHSQVLPSSLYLLDICNYM